ncbi:LAGLIDADG family homing endonuclease [Halobacteriaceae archaeon SHR40]|uniref:LAGLIDADG family homing endonuclease n=1 Tax=Halovenus amylolytica TaxID=2500550 RepID=UPI000FE42D77
MARADDTELIDSFEEFYRSYYRNEIAQLAQKYPNEQKSLYIDWGDLYRFDSDLADDFRNKPTQLREYAEEALRLYDLPVDVSLGQAHIRVQNLPETTGIREIRADHRGMLISAQGIVRKATDVRPKITTAAFECQRCGTLTRIPQEGGDFQEPHECQGCERQGPFRINYDQSEFIDAQKLRIQESPEGLRGGETPQSIDVHIEDDITGEVTPGDHVTATGILNLEQQGNDREKSAMFDVYMEGLSIEVEDEQFEEMDISEDDKKEIVELSNTPNIYEEMVGAIAPSIYGYEMEKKAMVFQLFSGVTKFLPDGSRTRGDLHILLVGDPGTGKCVKGDTTVTLGDGRRKQIGKLVEENLDDPVPVDDGVYNTVDIPVPSLTDDGRIENRSATKVWKREAPEKMYQITTASGREIEVTPSHPLFVQSDGEFVPREAEHLRTGQFIAIPRQISTTAETNLDIDYRRSQANNAVRLNLPDTWEPWLARLIGYIIAEGHVSLSDDHTGTVSITNNDSEILSDVRQAFDKLNLSYFERDGRDHKTASEINCTAGEFVSFLENLEPAILKCSAEQRVPEKIAVADTQTRQNFLQAYIESEGHVSTKQREIAVSSMSRELLEDVRSLLLSEGIHSRLEQRENGSHRLRISGNNFATYVEEIGLITERKSGAAAAFDGISQNTNTDVVPGVGELLRDVRESLALPQSECGILRQTYQHYERGDRNPSSDRLKTVVREFSTRIEQLHDLRKRVENNEWGAIESAREELNLSQRVLSEGMNVTQTAISYYERENVAPDGGKLDDARSIILDRIDEALAVTETVQKLETLAQGSVHWEKINSIKILEPDYNWVYDLEVADTHNYISNGIISHNSQLLQYIKNIAPRSVYTSGKGSSAAGLTAAAVRDDFGEGQQWTLEAGALVLADQGIAAVDELDKMRSEDQSAMHQALEQQSISVSKAGINATLKSRCSLLGAANPTYGRFDEYEPIGEQIDLTPPLISRFDLIFTVTDKPDEEKDSELAEHILQTNYAGELNTHRTETSASNYTQEEVERITDDVAPTIEPDLLRKYVAYAQRNCYPTMTEDAKSAIQEYYVDLRSTGDTEDAPVPVTARKLEALVRLSEASARVRLSDTVEESDAQRAIDIAQYCLEDIGLDPETGELDADMIETGTSKSQRDRIKNIKQLISMIEEEYDEGAPVDIIIERAEEEGIEESKTEHEIEKLKQKGEVYEPQQNHLRTT